MQHTTITEARVAHHRAEHGYGYCARCESEVDSNDRCDCDACDYCGERKEASTIAGERICAHCRDDMGIVTVTDLGDGKHRAAA